MQRHFKTKLTKPKIPHLLVELAFDDKINRNIRQIVMISAPHAAVPV